jgi:hypothetical protein
VIDGKGSHTGASVRKVSPNFDIERKKMENYNKQSENDPITGSMEIPGEDHLSIGQGGNPEEPAPPAEAAPTQGANTSHAAEAEKHLTGHVPSESGTAITPASEAIAANNGFADALTNIEVPVIDGKLDFSSFTGEQVRKYVERLAAQCRRDAESLVATVTTCLYPALVDLESRYKKERYRNDLRSQGELKEGWYAYLESLGLNPDAYRKWKQRRRHNAITAVERLCLLQKSNTKPLTEEQKEIAEALVLQGFKKNEANKLAKATEGTTFQERFASALAQRAGDVAGRTQTSGKKRDEVVTSGLKEAGEEPQGEEADQPDEEQQTPTGAEEFEPPQPSLILGKPVPEPDPGSMKELRQQIARMADTEEIAEALKVCLSDLVARLLQHHAYKLSAEFPVVVRRPSGGRFAVGDWVERVGKDDRLDQQVGRETALGHVVALAENLDHPKVRWHDGKNWQEKPHSLFALDKVRVLFPQQAQEKYPDAFASYPGTNQDGNTESARRQSAGASDTDAGSDVPPERRKRGRPRKNGGAVCPVDAPAPRVIPTSAPDVAPEIAAPACPQKHPAQTTEDAPRAKKPVKSLTLDGLTVKPGYRCKYNGVDCEITEVWGGHDGGVSLVRVGDQKPIGTAPVPVGDLRFVMEPEAMAG